MEDFWDSITAMACLTYSVFLVSLIVILIIQDVNYTTTSVLVVLSIASITMFIISHKHYKK